MWIRLWYAKQAHEWIWRVNHQGEVCALATGSHNEQPQAVMQVSPTGCLELGLHLMCSIHCKKKCVLLTHFGYLIPFPYHWRISLAKHSPITFTNVLENLITAGKQSRQWEFTVFNDAEEVENWSNQIESNNLFFLYSVPNPRDGHKDHLTLIVSEDQNENNLKPRMWCVDIQVMYSQGKIRLLLL